MTNDEVASPCISVCKIDEPSQRCMGCFRTIKEITQWRSMSNEAKQAVLNDTGRRGLRWQTADQKISDE